MERAKAMHQLPAAYARALVLRERGAEPDAIAADLGIVPEAVTSLLRLADAKLTRLLAEADAADPGAAAGGEVEAERAAQSPTPTSVPTP